MRKTTNARCPKDWRCGVRAIPTLRRSPGRSGWRGAPADSTPLEATATISTDGSGINRRIGRTDAEYQIRHHPPQRENSTDSRQHADPAQSQAVSGHHPQHAPGGRRRAPCEFRSRASAAPRPRTSRRKSQPAPAAAPAPRMPPAVPWSIGATASTRPSRRPWCARSDIGRSASAWWIACRTAPASEPAAEPARTTKLFDAMAGKYSHSAASLSRPKSFTSPTTPDDGGLGWRRVPTRR